MCECWCSALWTLCCAKRDVLCRTPRQEKAAYVIWARVVDVYDGDTVTLAMVERGRVVRRRCRCLGYDSPEMRGPDKERAIQARDVLKTLLPSRAFRVQVTGIDKYGRLLIDLRTGGRRVSDIMIERGMAYAYDGGKKRAFTPQD